jgi:TolB protein
MKRTSIAIAALATTVVAACSSSTGSTAVHPAAGAPAIPTTTTAAQPLAARGEEASIETIPWSQVGPGWMVATWSPARGLRSGEDQPSNEPSYETATTTLYLVDPAGGRYKITTFPPPGDEGVPRLIDWSGDGSKALFQLLENGDTAKAIVVDLHTGAQTTIDVDDYPRFTRPNGKALLLSNFGFSSGPSSLERVDLDGHKQLTYPTDKLGSDFNGRFVATADGTRLVLGTEAGLSLMGNDGTVGSTISVPGEKDCEPVRWWDGDASTTVLARCSSTEQEYTSSLWLVPIDGGEPTALTAQNDGQHSPDIGDVEAWKLPSGTFVQALGGCGVIYVAKLKSDGTTDKVSVPEADNGKSIAILGVDGSALNLHASAACGGGQTLLRYDPGTNTTTVLLGPSVNGGGVSDAVAFASQR